MITFFFFILPLHSHHMRASLFADQPWMIFSILLLHTFSQMPCNTGYLFANIFRPQLSSLHAPLAIYFLFILLSICLLSLGYLPVSCTFLASCITRHLSTCNAYPCYGHNCNTHHESLFTICITILFTISEDVL